MLEMKHKKKQIIVKNQRHNDILTDIIDINAFSKKDIESIMLGDAFVIVPSKELNNQRVQVYDFLI